MRWRRTITGLTCALAVSIAPASVAQAAPPATTHVSAASVIDEGYPSLTILKQRGWRLPNKCKLEQAKMLFAAGWKTPGQLEMALGITWRESNWRNLDESSPWYTGALGVWQVQSRVWSGKSWWSRGAMLDPYRQSYIVKKHFFKGGMYHWGLGFNRATDRWYFDLGLYNAIWGESLTQAWVVQPFLRGINQIPKKCRLKPRLVKVQLVEWADR